MSFKLWKTKPPRSVRRILHKLYKSPLDRFVIPNS